MKKFKAGRNEIKELLVIKETDKQIVYISDWSGREVRESKVSTYYSWHNTRDEAKEHLICEAKNRIETLNQQLRYNKEQLLYIESL